jgi:predicted membrane GTPase involved in stress response
LLKIGETRLLEPVMQVELVVDPEVLSAVISDLGQRRSTIVSISERAKQKVKFGLLLMLCDLLIQCISRWLWLKPLWPSYSATQGSYEQ